MDNLEEILQSFYESDQDYAKQMRTPLHVHPVFELATEKQLEMRERYVGVSEVEIRALLAEMLVMTQELDEISETSGMHGMPVVLTGRGIKLPSTRTIAESNTFVVGPSEQGSTLDKLESNQEVGGVFYGFGTRLEIISEDDTIAGVRPVMIYQVKVGNFLTVHANGSVFATGDVGETQLEFIDDFKYRRIEEALAILVTSDDEKLIKCVNKINIALAKKEKPDAALLRYVGFQSAYLTNLSDETENRKYVDALIDLISCYVDWDIKYRIGLDSIFKVPRLNERENGPIELIEGTDAEPLVSFEITIKQLVVMPVYRKDETVLHETGRNALYAATYTDNALWYFKLTDLETFDSD